MEREYAHKLLDHLNPDQFAAVGHLIEVLVHPVTKALVAAPPDDEPVTEEDIRSFQEARLESRGTSMENLIAEYGLTMDDLHAEIAQLDDTVPGRVA